jgi:hypothetical protein
MGLFIGIEPGQSFSGSAGARRPNVTLSVTEDGGVATIGSRKVAVSAATLVLWHQADAGTFGGIFSADAVKIPSQMRPEMYESPRMIFAESASGAANIAAAVITIEAGTPIVIHQCGYKGRTGHRFTEVTMIDGVATVTFAGTRTEYWAQYAQVEAL